MIVMLQAVSEDASAWHGFAQLVGYLTVNVDAFGQFDVERVGAGCEGDGLWGTAIWFDQNGADGQRVELCAAGCIGASFPADCSDCVTSHQHSNIHRVGTVRVTHAKHQGRWWRGWLRNLDALRLVVDVEGNGAWIRCRLCHGRAIGGQGVWCRCTLLPEL